jgi:probable lipoprotein (TIGR04455 family)
MTLPRPDRSTRPACDGRRAAGSLRHAWVFVLVMAALAACSSVQFERTRPEFAARDAQTLYRLHVVVAPAPAGDARLGAMWGAMARRYVNHHRDFIARQASVAAALDAAACGEGIEGVLHLHPQLRRTGGGARVRVVGRLLRCDDGAVVWEAAAADSWDADDDDVSALRAQYAGEFGAHVEPFVAPSFHALRALLDTLPRPKLVKDADIDEKIDVGQ